MSLDIVDLREFYINPLGQAARRLLRTRLARIWPRVEGKKVLSLGYGTPLLRPFLDEAAQVMVMMPGEQGVAYWPREGPNTTCLTDLNNLPLPDESVDRVIVMHALETAREPEAVLREVWRVLKGEGRALFIVPNRRGLWAHSDNTPFGTGRPYSSHQLKRALRKQGFLVERFWCALFMPPFQVRLSMALSEVWERGVGWLFPGFGGLVVMEASKQIYSTILMKKRERSRRLVLSLPLPFPSGPVPVRRD